VDFFVDFELQDRIEALIEACGFGHMNPGSITCMKSFGSKSDATARIWGLSRNWQMALGVGPRYIIEVISRRFDSLSDEEQDKILIHELLHIPKTFSGALVPHKCFGKMRVGDKQVEVIYQQLRKKKTHTL
jgi:predicted metallopeptidase